MGTRHTRQDILDGAVRVLFQHGVGGLSFRQVGADLGIADRTVVYYFPTKAELLQSAVVAGSQSLQSLLTDAFGEDSLTTDELIQRAWPVLRSATARPWMRVYFELIGASARGEEPHRTLARTITDAWIEWLSDRVALPDRTARRQAASHVVATIDGLLVLDIVGLRCRDSPGTRQRQDPEPTNKS